MQQPNPADILTIGRTDPGFVVAQELSKVFVLTHLVPAEQSLDDPAHGFEVRSPRESEFCSARRSKHDVRRIFRSSLQGSGPASTSRTNTPGSITKGLDGRELFLLAYLSGNHFSPTLIHRVGP